MNEHRAAYQQAYLQMKLVVIISVLAKIVKFEKVQWSLNYGGGQSDWIWNLEWTGNEDDIINNNVIRWT